MPIIDRQDAADVEEQFKSIFAVDQSRRSDELRKLFVEKLDFEPVSGFVPLATSQRGVELPEQSERLAVMSGVTAVYVHLSETQRVNKREAAAASKLISDELGDILLVMTNSSASQVHFIYPSVDGPKPSLRRLIIERDLPRRTAIQQLSNIYWNWNDTKDIRGALEKVYDVEAVTTQFFREYKRVFDNMMEKVQGFGNGEEEQEAKKLFVQTLFNRLMFVYFLSRKGWLTFNGDKDYLNALWKDYPARSEDKNFYNSRLKNLFFLGLNNERSSKELTQVPGLEDLIGDPPFLNGGLFDEWDQDKKPGVVVPDETVHMVLSELFNKFNFTVMESTPLDVEVAVDPEMLGKVFEELVTGRHETGSYYTPRSIVAFMGREALKGYLEGEVPELTAEAVQLFVDEQDVSTLNVGTAGKVREALEKVTILDPACGSGAYLVGMLQELVELETALYSERLVHDPRSIYELKLRIIQRNLYGADIDEFAVNIAMLRLWLSLAIDYEGDQPEPLPNLDFKIVCGDSLTSPDPAPEHQLRMFVDQARGLRERLEATKARYMTARGHEKSQAWQQIRDMETELEGALSDRAADDSSLEWRVQFAEVFDKRGGFDIVIANPPYRRQEGLASRKAKLEKLYPQVYASTADYHVYFYNRSVQLLREGGQLSFITSNKYMRAQYGQKIRGFLPAHLALSQVVDFGDLPVFAAASYPAIVIGRKVTPSADHQLHVADLVMPVRSALARRGLAVNKETVARAMDELPEFLKSGVPGYPQVLLRKSGWILQDTDLVRLFDRLMSLGTPLINFLQGRMYYGIKTGLNDAFVINEDTRQQLIAADPSSAELLRPWLRGQDIERWRVQQSGHYLIALQSSDDSDSQNVWGSARTESQARRIFREAYPAIHEHLARYEEYETRDNRGRIKRVGLRLRQDQGRWWWELRSCAYYHEFDQSKIIWPDITATMRVAWDTGGHYIGNTAYMGVQQMWLVALLNSSLFEFLVRMTSTEIRGGYVRLIRSNMAPLPIVKPPTTLQQKLSHLVADLSQNPGQPNLEAKTEETILGMYGVSAEEKRALRRWFKARTEYLPSDSDMDPTSEN